MLNKALLSCFCTFALANQAWAEATHGEQPHSAADIIKKEADEIQTEVEHAADITHAASGGLPQFDPAWFPSQIFWLVLSFAILYVIFSKKTLPEISSVIENRKNHIQADLETAERITAEADSVQNAYQKNLDKAQNDAADAIKTVENKVKLKSEKAMDDFKHKSDVALKETEKRIETSKLAAMDDMNQIAIDTATEAVKKIIGQTPDKGQLQMTVKNISGKLQSDKAKAA